MTRDYKSPQHVHQVEQPNKDITGSLSGDAGFFNSIREKTVETETAV